MNKTKRSMLNSGSSVIGYIIPMLINLITTPLLLDLLGQDAYGINSLVAVVIGYFTVMDMGLGFPIIKYISEYKSLGQDHLIGKLLNTTIALYICIGLAGFVLIIALSKVFALQIFNIPLILQNDAIIVFIIASFGFLASVGMSWGRALFHGLQRYDITASVSVFNQLFGILLGIGAVINGYGIVGYVGVRVIITILSASIYLVISRRFVLFSLRPRFDREIIMKIREYMGYGVINRVIGSLLGRADVTIIGITTNVAAVGIYSIPLMIVRSLGYMIAFSVGFVFPAISELMAKKNIIKSGLMFNYVNQIMMIIIGLVFVPLYFWGDVFLELWVTEIASEAVPLLKVLTIYAIIGNSTTTTPNNIMLGAGKIKYFTFFNISKGIISTIAIYFFILKYGIIGVPIALVLTELLGFPYLIYCIKYVLQLPVLLTLLNLFRPLFVIALIGFIFNLSKSYIDSWFNLILVVFGFLVTALIISWSVLLKKDIKTLIKNVVFSN